MKLVEEHLWYLEAFLLAINVVKILFQLILGQLNLTDLAGFTMLLMFAANTLVIYIMKERDYKRTRELEDNFHQFLRDLAQQVLVGESLPEAIGATSETDYGALSEEIKQTYNHVSWGIPVNEALERMGERSGSPHLKSSLSIILDASESGGKIIKGLESTADYSERLHEIRRERKRSTRIYTIIFYLSFLIFIAIVIVLVNSLLPALLGTQVRNTTSSIGFKLEDIKIVLFYMTLIQGTFSGVMAGKISEGSVIAGIKHSLLLLIAAILSFYFLVF